MTRTWSAVLARLGVPTGDGRIIAPGAGSSRDLPLPLMYQPMSGDGHGGSVVVGRIDSLRIGEGMVTSTGSLLESAPWEVIEQLEAGVIGPSVDLDDIEYTMDDAERIVVTRWRIAGATLVAIPAFEGVSLTLDPVPVEPDTAPEDVPYLYASATPAVLPDLAAFRKPELTELTPLTVTAEVDGWRRVFGHIAGRDTCHVGLPGCVTPPMGYSTYEQFHVSAQQTREGVLLPVGTLVAGPRHADARAAFRAAQQHYDDLDARVAKVVAGEDEFGIWVSGWILPDAKPAALEAFFSSPVSGDWRDVGGKLELIAVCSVNAPGFPVPRARVAFGLEDRQRTLIASTGMKPVEGEYVAPVPVPQGEVARWLWATAQTGGTSDGVR